MIYAASRMALLLTMGLAEVSWLRAGNCDTIQSAKTWAKPLRADAARAILGDSPHG